ncbi:MAG: hypothetical protein ACTSVV_00285 [Promethearchaeota archaeon]
METSIKKLEKSLKNARQKLELAFKNIIEKEKFANFYKYYANYYWVKSSDLQIKIWLKELDNLIKNRPLLNNDADLANNFKQIENSLIHILANLRKCDKEASEKGWKLRFWYPTIKDYIKSVYKNAALLRRKMKKITL